MTQKERLPHALVTAMMFLALLGTVGCMTWAPGGHERRRRRREQIDPAIDPGQSAQPKCEDFTCEP